MGIGWILCLVFGGALIFAGLAIGKVKPKVRKSLVIAGIAIALVGGLAIQIVFLLPLLVGKPSVSYEECREVDVANMLHFAICIITGYAPKEAEIWTLTSFAIFGILAPLSLLIYLFYDATDFLSRTVRAPVSFLCGLIAFRGFLSTFFVEFLTFGMTGMGLLLVNFLFMSMLYSRISKAWKGAELVEQVIATEAWEEYGVYKREYERIEKSIEDLESTISEVVRQKGEDSPEVKKLKQQLKNLQDRKEELKEKLEEIGKKLRI